MISFQKKKKKRKHLLWFWDGFSLWRTLLFSLIRSCKIAGKSLIRDGRKGSSFLNGAGYILEICPMTSTESANKDDQFSFALEYSQIWGKPIQPIDVEWWQDYGALSHMWPKHVYSLRFIRSLTSLQQNFKNEFSLRSLSRSLGKLKRNSIAAR